MLAWNDIAGAIKYYVYRSDSFIWTIEGLSPIATVFSNSHTDNLPAEGHYFYVIVADDGVVNSSISNCQYIYYELPHVQEFFITTSLILSISVILFVLNRFRRRKR